MKEENESIKLMEFELPEKKRIKISTLIVEHIGHKIGELFIKISVVPFNVTGSGENKWDKDSRWWSTPYSWENSFFTGYSHVNLRGVGCPDLGVILVMPTTGEVTARLKEYGSEMSQQKASPGYYSCFLDKYDVLTEVTSTKRSGLSRFTFPEGKSN